MRPQPKIIRSLLDTLRTSSSCCVVGHVRPDGDCIGSQLALTLALQQQGKQVACWNQDPLPDKLAFLDPTRILTPPRPGQHFDCVIATDCASLERLGRVAPCITSRRILLNIDHHGSNTRYGDLNWIAAREPSTGELIFRLLRAARWPITPPIADCLFTAVSTDTGSFQYPSTLPSTYHVAAELVKLGANLARICSEVYQSYPLSRVHLLRHLYSRFRLTHRDQIAYCWLRQTDYARTGASPEDCEGLIDHLRAIQTVTIACIFEEMEPHLTRISLRSKDPRLNVSDVAALFGGGGHPAAAGARIPGTPASVQRRVLTALNRALDHAKL